jgi:hypothetical protein
MAQTVRKPKLARAKPAPGEVRKIFLVFDPGGTTGVATGFHRGTEDSIVLVESVEIEWQDRFRVYDYVVTYKTKAAARNKELVVVTEDFLPNPRAVASLAHRHVLSSEVIGMIEVACNHSGITLCRQLPAVRHGVKVLAQHAAQVGASPHRNDAYQHFRYKIIEDIRRPSK